MSHSWVLSKFVWNNSEWFYWVYLIRLAIKALDCEFFRNYLNSKFKANCFSSPIDLDLLNCSQLRGSFKYALSVVLKSFQRNNLITGTALSGYHHLLC